MSAADDALADLAKECPRGSSALSHAHGHLRHGYWSHHMRGGGWAPLSCTFGEMFMSDLAAEWSPSDAQRAYDEARRQSAGPPPP